MPIRQIDFAINDDIQSAYCLALAKKLFVWFNYHEFADVEQDAAA